MGEATGTLKGVEKSLYTQVRTGSMRSHRATENTS